MNTSPAISVIMPCYNSRKTVRESISSVDQQTFRDFELIVVDDGSTDGSSALLDELARQRPFMQIIHQENRGLPAARNRGLEKATGHYVAFLDSDDTWSEYFLEKMYLALENQPGAALAYCGWQNLGLSKNRDQPFIPPDYETPLKTKLLLSGCRWPVHAVLARRSTIEEAGKFNECLKSCEDFDLWLRTAIHNPILRVPEVLAFYHHHGNGQMTSNTLRIALSHFQVQKNFLRDHPEIQKDLGNDGYREILYGELNTRAMSAIWNRDLDTAHKLCRKLLFSGYIKKDNIKYILASLLPFSLYQRLIRNRDRS